MPTHIIELGARQFDEKETVNAVEYMGHVLCGPGHELSSRYLVIGPQLGDKQQDTALHIIRKQFQGVLKLPNL